MESSFLHLFLVRDRPDISQFRTEYLQRLLDDRAGFWRLHRLFTELEIPATVFGVATALARGPDQVRAMQDAGWEIASHGLKWIEYKDYSADDERADLDEAVRLHTLVTGERPRGWYTGRCSVHTLKVAADRITSYNVCYTKLLRDFSRNPRSSA